MASQVENGFAGFRLKALRRGKGAAGLSWEVVRRRDGGRIKIAWRGMKAKKAAPDEPAQPSFLSIRLEENVFV